jgi:hypothetical protein
LKERVLIYQGQDVTSPRTDPAHGQRGGRCPRWHGENRQGGEVGRTRRRHHAG